MTGPRSLDPLTDRTPMIRDLLNTRYGEPLFGEALVWCLDEIAALQDALRTAETDRDDYRQRLAEIHGQLVDKVRRTWSYAQRVREGEAAAADLTVKPSGGTFILGADGTISVIRTNTGQEGDPMRYNGDNQPEVPAPTGDEQHLDAPVDTAGPIIEVPEPGQEGEADTPT